MVAMPPALTAATGMDALTHALEAYLSTESTPVTDACALHAIRLITTYLRDAVKDGEDIRARDMMVRCAAHARSDLLLCETAESVAAAACIIICRLLGSCGR